MSYLDHTPFLQGLDVVVLERLNLYPDAAGAASPPALAFLHPDDGQSVLPPLEKRIGP